ncbi:LOW QUALITY PROTEIN: hypothetical protein PanWU01x14_130100 [Parasponia andersonii]|uniref:Uncharacterized protein n=1 Tax=Parasponia andersonii TaxID=3476 RepID=A0A2P5CRC2_PARAD|nr:LOW QUALITY PROTEIN: hypothetical protein PanWU01x14_130100 [Parasponia andersonii]
MISLNIITLESILVSVPLLKQIYIDQLRLS